MKIIGLCGGSGSGKGVVCRLLCEQGIPSIDTDGVYHDIIRSDSACAKELASAFGSSIIDACGGVDRRALGQIVFGENSGEKLKILNEITHRHILDKTREIIREYDRRGVNTVIVDAPLLFESGFDRECDATIAVTAEKENRIERIISRDGLSREDAIKRIESQKNDDELKRLCSFVIENNADLTSLKAAVADVVKKINLIN